MAKHYKKHTKTTIGLDCKMEQISWFRNSVVCFRLVSWIFQIPWFSLGIWPVLSLVMYSKDCHVSTSVSRTSTAKAQVPHVPKFNGGWAWGKEQISWKSRKYQYNLQLSHRSVEQLAIWRKLVPLPFFCPSTHGAYLFCACSHNDDRFIRFLKLWLPELEQFVFIFSTPFG